MKLVRASKADGQAKAVTNVLRTVIIAPCLISSEEIPVHPSQMKLGKVFKQIRLQKAIYFADSRLLLRFQDSSDLDMLPSYKIVLKTTQQYVGSRLSNIIFSISITNYDITENISVHTAKMPQ